MACGISTRLVLAALAGASLAVGCGDDDTGDSKASIERFQRDGRAATRQVTAIGVELAQALREAKRASNAALATQFGGLAGRTRGVIDDLGRLDPPDDARYAVARLVKALRTGARDLDAIAAAARAADVRTARSATRTLVKDSPAIRAAKNILDFEVTAAG